MCTANAILTYIFCLSDQVEGLEEKYQYLIYQVPGTPVAHPYPKSWELQDEENYAFSKRHLPKFGVRMCDWSPWHPPH